MAQVDEILAQMRRNPKGVRFHDLCQVCDFFFGKPASAAAVIVSTGHPGREILGSIFRMTRGWPKPIK